MPTLTALSFTPTGPNAHLALPRLHAHLAAGNDACVRFVTTQFVGRPTLRVLAPGTFAAYRDWRAGGGGGGPGGSAVGVGIGQVKVPSVVFDAGAVAWFEERVVLEVLGGTVP